MLASCDDARRRRRRNCVRRRRTEDRAATAQDLEFNAPWKGRGKELGFPTCNFGLTFVFDIDIRSHKKKL